MVRAGAWLATIVAMIEAAPAVAAPPSAAASACAVEGIRQLYEFLSERPLTAPEKALLRRETLNRPADISPSECADLKKLSAVLGTKDAVLRAERRADIHNNVWFRLESSDQRRPLLQRMAPIVVEDRSRKVVIRRRAIEAFMASRAFIASNWGLTAPSSTVEREAAELRAEYRQSKPEVIQLIQYQESYWEALRRGWAGKPQGWRESMLAKLGRPKTRDDLDARTAQLQLAVVTSNARANEAAALQRFRRKMNSYDAAIQNAAAKSGFLAGVYGSR